MDFSSFFRSLFSEAASFAKNASDLEKARFSEDLELRLDTEGSLKYRSKKEPSSNSIDLVATLSIFNRSRNDRAVQFIYFQGIKMKEENFTYSIKDKDIERSITNGVLIVKKGQAVRVEVSIQARRRKLDSFILKASVLHDHKHKAEKPFLIDAENINIFELD